MEELEKLKKSTKRLTITIIIILILYIVLFLILLINDINTEKSCSNYSYENRAKSYAIEAFNYEFIKYEGEQPRLIVKGLIDKVKLSNENNKDHQIEIHGITTDVLGSPDNQKFDVNINYGSDGYINKINISRH